MEALKEDKIPWKRGWRTSQPYNAVSGNNYHGVNNLLLSFIAHEKGYSDPRWCTFKQAADNNWHINKGEKGTPIEFWSLYDSETKKKLTPAEADKLKNELSREDYQERVHPLSETYTVFNAEQISGIPELEVENNLVDVKSLIEKRDVLIENMSVNFLEQGWEAYYSKDRDLLSLPPVHEFNSNYEYFAVLLHEGAHATGHEKRLNRDLSGIKGSASYAKEELRAEIASAFVSQEIGFEQTEANIDNHKAYLQSWIEVLENNPDELYTAIRDAQKISDYLIEKGEFNQVIEQSTEKDIKSSSGDINLEQNDITAKQREENIKKFNKLAGELKSQGFETSWDEDKKITQVYKPPEKPDDFPETIGYITKEAEFIKTAGFDKIQMYEIWEGLEQGLDISTYAKPEFDYEQMRQIRKGLERGLDVSLYAKPVFSESQMDEIREGLTQNLDVSIYAKPEFEWEQMHRILQGLEKGLDVSIYAKPEFSETQMYDIRKKLEQMEEIQKELQKGKGMKQEREETTELNVNKERVFILGYYTREDNTQFIHYKINEKEYLTSGIVTWSKESQLKRISELTQVEQLPDIEQMKKNLEENEPYGALNKYFQNREKQNDTIEEIKKFAQNHNVPIYTKMPEEFHINEGALTAPIGTQWIQDNGSILHKTIKRGLLLDENLAGLYEAEKRPKSSEKNLSDKKHGLSNKNQNMGDSQRHNPILNTNNNVMKNIAANFIHQQQEKKELIKQ